MRVTTVRRVLAATCSALLLAACGSAASETWGSSASADSDEPTEAAAAADALADEAPADDADAQAEPADDAEPLRMGLPPGEDPSEFLTRFEPLVEVFEEVTGRPVEAQVTADYLGVVEALRGGFVDFAMFSPFATVIGLETAPIELLLVGEGRDEPASLIAVRADSGITSLEQLEGRSIAFVDPVSATGMFMPRSHLVAEAGLEAEVDYELTYAGGHDSAVLGVLAGSVDAAGFNYGIYNRMVEEGAIDPEELTILAETDPIPLGVTFVAREGLDEDVRQAIVDKLPALWAEDPRIAELLGGGVLREPGEGDLDVLEQVITNLGISLEDIR